MEEKIRVFISYRHAGSDIYPKFLQTSLSAKGFSVFLDTSSMHTGTFDTQIYTEIDRSTAVLLLLPPGALDRCVNDGDWVRQEIAYSLQNGKCIIPLMMEGFAGFPEDLPEDIAAVQFYNGKPLNPANWDEVMGWLDMEIRSAAQKRSVTVMCPHCGRETEQVFRHEQQTVFCENCSKSFVLLEGAVVRFQRGFIIEGNTLVKYVGHAKRLKIPSPKIPRTEHISVIGKGAFSENTTLEEVDFSEEPEYGAHIYSIEDGAFAGCTNLKKIILPEEIESIGACAFMNCSALTEIELPEEMDSLGEGLFSGCSSLRSVRLPESVMTNGSVLPNGIFENCSALTHIALPEDIEAIGEYAFSGCRALQSIAYDDGNEIGGFPPKLKRIGYSAFSDCESLAKLGGVGCNEQGYKLHDPEPLDNLWLPDGMEFIDTDAFANCTSLETIILPPKVVLAGKAFRDCTNLSWVEGLTDTAFKTHLERGLELPFSAYVEDVFQGTPFAEQYQS